MRYKYDVAINNNIMRELSSEQIREIAYSCPTRVYEYDEYTKEIRVENDAKCMDCGECVKKAQGMNKKNCLSINKREETFIFEVEVRSLFLHSVKNFFYYV